MSRNTQTIKVYVNESYIRSHFKENNLNFRQESINIGKSKAYLSNAIAKHELDKTAMLLLCHNTGMDFVTATDKEEPEKALVKTDAPAVAGGGVTPSELRELTELVISYIQDLGKIHTETLRELKETKLQIKEMTEKHNREFHELDIYLRNSGAEARKSREAMNSNLSMIHNYLQRKLEQQIK